MSAYVIDASVVAKWFTEEEYSETALGLLRKKVRLYAPDLLMLEVDSVICKWIKRGLISLRDGKAIHQELRQKEITYYNTFDLAEDAFELANQTGGSVYDCLYLALAIKLDIKLITADHKFYESLAIADLADYVEWIENI